MTKISETSSVLPNNQQKKRALPVHRQSGIGGRALFFC